jgi:hypothetical protein
MTKIGTPLLTLLTKPRLVETGCQQWQRQQGEVARWKRRKEGGDEA